MSDLHEKPISGTAASLQAVSAVTLVWTFLTSALVAAGLALLSVAAFDLELHVKPTRMPLLAGLLLWAVSAAGLGTVTAAPSGGACALTVTTP